MSEKMSGALNELRLTLARWRAPSVWDVVNRDEPLDPAPEGHWESAFVSNVTSTMTISIPSGTTFTTGNTLLVTMQESAVNALAHAEDMNVFRALEGMMSPGQNSAPSTAYARGDELVRGRILPGHPPYPRNHKERRILKSIERKLPALIRQAERKLGPLWGAKSESEWNDEFWKMVTLSPQVDRTRNTRR